MEAGSSLSVLRQQQSCRLTAQFSPPRLAVRLMLVCAYDARDWVSGESFVVVECARDSLVLRRRT